MTVVEIVLPIFLLVFLGNWFKQVGFPGEAFWQPVERITYYILFPALVVTSLAEADFTGMPVGKMAAAISIAILLVTSLVYSLRSFLSRSNNSFSSIYQGTVRMNTYIGFSITKAVYSDEGLAAAAIAVAVIVPLVNLTCVWTLVRFSQDGKLPKLRVLQEVGKNPLIGACFVGALLNMSGWGLPPILGTMLEILARAALPLGLLAVGAALQFRGLQVSLAVVATATAIKLAILPCLTWTLSYFLGLQGMSAFVAVLFTGLPTAPSAYILARQLGGDSALMSGLIAIQTLVSLGTLPVLMYLLL